MQRFRVRAGRGDYEVVVGRGAWRAFRAFPRARYSSVVVLTEPFLWRRWGREFSRAAGLAGARVIRVPAGEGSKSLATVERVARGLVEAGADRRSLLVAFGGGVIGDLGGFVAATFMRGIDYVQIPTTVVAQVDSSVGGKTAVNAAGVKNLVGSFYPPRLVLADPQVLGSLPERAFRSGLYEIVKHAILDGPRLFSRLEKEIGALTPRNAARLGAILAEAVRVKIGVVARDERESGLRRVLNLGHTFGHALEEVTRYRRFLHGEAVGWGLLAAIRLSERVGLLAAADAARMARLVQCVGPLPPIRDLDVRRVLALLPRDKKAVGGRIHWVLPERLGKMRITPEVPPAEAAAAFRDVQRAKWHE
jgi:3-dehydroquinate synthase